MTFVPAMSNDELWTGEMRGMKLCGRPVLLLRLDGEVRAFEDRCPHLGVKLSQGTLAGSVLTCSAHHYQYDANDGAGINPRTLCLRQLPSRVVDGVILVDPSLEEPPSSPPPNPRGRP